MFGEEFTASNGLRVRHNPKTGYFDYFGEALQDWIHVSPCAEDAPSMVALGEFFQAKRDKELCRWRWPENPELVVYERVKAEVVGVLHEPTGQLLPIKRGEFPEDTTGYSGAANAYFAAHPEPKPWRDAKPGEVWVLTWGNELYNHPQPALVLNNGTFALRDSDSEIDSEKFTELDDPTIIDARRIYPEAE